MSSTDQTERNIKNPVVAIAGATGAVGVELMQCLEQRKFPLVELRLLASARSAGKTMKFRGGDIAVQELTDASLEGVDIALFSAGGAQSKRFAPAAVRARCGGGRQLVVLSHEPRTCRWWCRRSTPVRCSSTRASSPTRTAWPSSPPRRCGPCTRSAGSSASPCPRTRPPRAPAPPPWKSSANPRARISKAVRSRRKCCRIRTHSTCSRTTRRWIRKPATTRKRPR